MSWNETLASSFILFLPLHPLPSVYWFLPVAMMIRIMMINRLHKRYWATSIQLMCQPLTRFTGLKEAYNLILEMLHFALIHGCIRAVPPVHEPGSHKMDTIELSIIHWISYSVPSFLLLYFLLLSASLLLFTLPSLFSISPSFLQWSQWGTHLFICRLNTC